MGHHTSSGHNFSRSDPAAGFRVGPGYRFRRGHVLKIFGSLSLPYPTEALDARRGSRRTMGDTSTNEDEAGDVMTAPEVATLLRVGRNHVYDLAGRNEIPHRRVGKHLRFSRSAIAAWLKGG